MREDEEMIAVEAWTTIRYLHAQGKSIRAIAKELSLSRNSVRAALRQDNPPRYSRPRRANPKLEPYLEEIERMYMVGGFIGSRILRELCAQGYQGGRTALYTHLATLKENGQGGRLSMRFETAPGQQGQFDWSPYYIVVGQETAKVTVFCLTLCYSRRKFYYPSLDESQASVFEAVEAGLRHFGGSPKELLVDNARAFVDNAAPDHFTWNRHFLELCGHYCIQPLACPVAWPRSKGKVERPFYYLEQHLIKGGHWDSFDAFTIALLSFSSGELDHLIHSTTQERPIERFQKEKDCLIPLPERAFLSSQQQTRKVSWDCLISFAGSRYSVPWQQAGKRVWLRTHQGTKLLLYAQDGEQIAWHLLSEKRGITVIDPGHYQGLQRGLPKTRVLLEESFLHLFPDCSWFLAGLYAQHKLNRAAQLRAILSLSEVYPTQKLRESFALARQYNTYSPSFIRQLLQSGPATVKETEPGLSLPSYASRIGADLSTYQRILEAGR